MSELYVHVSPKGYQVYRLVNGRYRLDIGPAWPTPKEAAHYAKLLDQDHVSPLRDPGVASPVASVPSPGAVGVEVTPGPRSVRT